MFVGIAFINAMLVSTLCGSEYVQAGPITVLPDSLPLLRTHCIRGGVRLMVNIQLDATSRRPSMDNHEYHGKQSLSRSREVLFMPR